MIEIFKPELTAPWLNVWFCVIVLFCYFYRQYLGKDSLRRTSTHFSRWPNWYVGVHGKVWDSVSVWHNESACRRPLHHVKRPHQFVWSENRLLAGPQVSLHVWTVHSQAERWAPSLKWKHWFSWRGFERPERLFLHMRKKVSIAFMLFLFAVCPHLF